MICSRRRFLCAASIVVVLPAEAAEGWIAKNPPEWTPDDIQTILGQSPWAKTVNPELSSASLRASAKKGHRAAAADGIRDKRILTDFSVLVRWESALPILLARKRAPSAYPEDNYVLSISRLPMTFMAALVGGSSRSGAAPDANLVARKILETSLLQREGKDNIRADHAEWVESDFETRLLLMFHHPPEPVAVTDTAITFLCRMGSVIVQASFPLKAMIYRNRLEL